MNTRIAKWGNSLALRIPAAVAEQIAVGEGAFADLMVENGCLVVKPLGKPVYDLDDLLAGIDPENVYDEISTGAAVGNEFC